MVGPAAATSQQGEGQGNGRDTDRGTQCHSAAQVFIQPIFTECLLGTRHCTSAGDS